MSGGQDEIALSSDSPNCACQISYNANNSIVYTSWMFYGNQILDSFRSDAGGFFADP